MQNTTHMEPAAGLACRWWTDLQNVWTPIGWKDHLFRFNVLYEGTILAEPELNRRTSQWAGQGMQLGFIPSSDGLVPWWRVKRETYRLDDTGGRIGNQGWTDRPTPVLWTEWDSDGVVLRQEVFGHIPGAAAIQSGIEPLFAWVRLSARAADPEAVRPAKHGFLIKLNAPHMSYAMDQDQNLIFSPEKSAYPRGLTLEGCQLIEEDGKVRLGVIAGSECDIAFTPRKDEEYDSFLYVRMPVEEGRHADLLLPMLPADPAVLDSEFELGYDAALRESDRFWSVVPPTAAHVETTEPLVNDVIKHTLRLAEVIAERNPADGQYSLLSGSWCYARLWATPYAMASVMLLDTLGYHKVAERHLEIFKKEQGTVVPPGDSFQLHPGYLSVPKTLTSIDWLSDHGALLYAICQHGLLSGDRGFTDRWMKTVVRACEFVKDSRAMTGHGGVEGIMPPAVATDMRTKIQGVWSDGWNYKGLSSAIRLLRKTGHPRAEEFAEEARAYKEAFGNALTEKTALTPEWTDSAGRKRHLVPADMMAYEGVGADHVFYLDTGPLFPVFAGLMDADDELMRDTCLFLREGPSTKTFIAHKGYMQPPVLVHEMSSWEPCYSWNVFHSHQLGDRSRFQEGMYSLFAGSVSRQTFISCETRGGITGTIFAAPLPIYLARLAVIDDQLEEGTLHLLRLAPLIWLNGERPAVFERMPTEFGPVTLKAQIKDDGRTLAVVFQPEFRERPERMILHVPPAPGVERILLNGKQMEWDGRAAWLRVEG